MERFAKTDQTPTVATDSAFVVLKQNKTRLGALLLVCFFGVGCGSPAKDLAAICELVTEVQKDKSKSQKKKSIAIMKNIRDVVSTGEVSDLIKTVSKKPKKKRYKSLVSGAKKLGVKKYKCKAAKKWLSSL